MWKPPVSFLTLHYAFIISCALLSFLVIYAQGNMPAIDAFFFGASGSTESGLNTFDVKDLKLYQQVVIYVIPVITNLAFISILVVVVRLHWFHKRFKQMAGNMLRDHDQLPGPAVLDRDIEDTAHESKPVLSEPQSGNQDLERKTTIRFAEEAAKGEQSDENPLYMPPPHLRDRGYPLVEVPGPHGTPTTRRARSRSLERVMTSVIAPGPSNRTRSSSRSRSKEPRPQSAGSLAGMPKLSSQVTIGRNSQFSNLSEADKETLGGVEYRALRLLLKIVTAYFFGLHLLGVICLLPWIHTAPAKYTDYLAEMGQGKTWWAFYSAQTMINNLGFTLTPDSMISFRDATWPMLIMSFLAFAGNTCYPVFLRLLIWMMSVCTPKHSKLQQPLQFLLDHPRRCYTLLFPSKPTWILFGIVIVLNFIDVLLIIVLDLDNPAVTEGLPAGPRVLAALFQAASSRHTGTATFNLAEVNPAVQFSLLVMMYIAIFPIAMSIRASNTYEEQSLGIYSTGDKAVLTERNAQSYLLTHIQNQLSFDLWYIFLGIFCICIAESSRIMDNNNPAFSIFAIFFEVISAYGNVGLSLGHPDVMTSLSGQFTAFSKVVVCLMMIRGRHRMLPYSLDRAIMLPNERDRLESSTDDNHAVSKGAQSHQEPAAASTSANPNRLDSEKGAVKESVPEKTT